MDVLKFMKERRRMCDYYSRCFECPRADEPNCNIEEMSDEEFENFVNTVEQWSKEHPQRTRLQDFREKYPDALMKQGNCPKTCAKDLGYCKECPYVKGLICDCDECWNMPVEDDKQ